MLSPVIVIQKHKVVEYEFRTDVAFCLFKLCWTCIHQIGERKPLKKENIPWRPSFLIDSTAVSIFVIMAIERVVAFFLREFWGGEPGLYSEFSEFQNLSAFSYFSA